jgi:hypothetical protein
MKSGQRSAEGAPEGEQAPSGPKPHERVAPLIARAREDADSCKQLIDALIAMRAPGDEADEARVVLGQLDAKALDGLLDETGRDAKAEAIETLLSLGFPHALNVTPEDLAWFRGVKPQALGDVVRRIHRTRRNMWVAAIVSQLLTVGAAASQVSREPLVLLIAALSASLVLGGAAWLKSLPLRLEGQAMPIALLVLGLFISLVAAAMSGPVALTGEAIAALGLVGVVGWQLPETGD